MSHGQHDRLDALQCRFQVFLDADVDDVLLVAEEARPRVPGGRVGVLALQLVPVVHVGVVNAEIGPHLGELADDQFAAAVAGVAHVLAVAGPAQQHAGARDVSPHVPQGVADQLGRVQGARVVDVDGGGGHLEDGVAVLEAQDVLVRPVAQPAVLGQAIPANARTREDDVAVRRAHLDRLDHLDEVHAVALGEEGPLVEEGQDRRPVGILDDLGGLRLDRAVHHGQGELLGVEDLSEEPFHAAAALRPPPREGLLEDRVGHELGGPGRHGGFDEHQARRADVLPDCPQRVLQRAHFRLAGPQVAQVLLAVIALHVHHDAIGQFEALAVVGGSERLLVPHAPGDHGLDLRVLRFHGRLAPVEHRRLPVASRAGPLAADHELGGLARLPVSGVGDDGGHDGPHEAQTHHDDDLLALGAGGLDERLNPGELEGVFLLCGDGERFAGRADGNLSHGDSSLRRLGGRGASRDRRGDPSANAHCLCLRGPRKRFPDFPDTRPPARPQDRH
ncbi:MAG: hypothetical protein BWX88_04821 [Planctomycetes bacterium ADurb.Bin126]|nr:MAG: hypothetical protein BWX88_04821 [Planctomycetes bacterium ADurb.Bin126]